MFGLPALKPLPPSNRLCAGNSRNGQTDGGRYPPITVICLVKSCIQVAPWMLGRGIDALETVIDLIPLREHKYPGTYLCRAMAGLDTAVWDLRGKMAGQPVTALLGGTAGDLRAYASSMRRDITPEEEANRLKALCDQYGFDACKIRVAAECGRDVDEWPGREAIIPYMRAAMGDDIALLADANSGFPPTGNHNRTNDD